MLNLVSVRLETVLVSAQGRCMVFAKCIVGSENHFGRTRWYSSAIRLKWKLVLVRLEVVRILTQDRCMVCVEHIIGLENVFDAPDGTPR